MNDVRLLSFCLPETSSLATWMGTTTSTALLWGEFHSLLSLREGDGWSLSIILLFAAAVAFSTLNRCARRGEEKRVNASRLVGKINEFKDQPVSAPLVRVNGLRRTLLMMP